ncbi:hypothetical protein ACET3Z_003865 [Daucus carota]
MAPNKLSRDFSPSGKVAYATTNYVAFLDKESVHADFHFLMDFLRISPISYALTESPPIYAEIVDEMWRTADCNSPGGGISFTIKGNPYILTPSVINEALHFPNSDLENTPTSAAIISMLKAINYAASPWFLGRINTKHFRKEWSYFFETLYQEMPPADIRDAIPVVEIPSSPEEERAKNDLLLLEPAREQEDRQVLMNAASILKSQLVTTLTRQAERISTQEMMTLADKCYNALEGLGDDFSSFRCSISKLIAHNQKLQSAAKKIEDWNECDIEARYIHQEQSLIEEEQGLSSAQGKLSTTETHADSLKIKREELKGMIRNLTEELNEVEETVKTLRAETDQREEARSIAKAELRKLEAEKQESRSAIKAIKDQYNADKKVLERMSDHLLQQLQQVRK